MEDGRKYNLKSSPASSAYTSSISWFMLSAMGRGTFAVVGAIVAAALIAGLASQLTVSARRTVTVGVYDNPPKTYSTEAGRPAGLFIELLEEMAQRERWDLRYVTCQWLHCLELLESGRLDLMPDVAFSGERAARFDFHSVSVASSWSQIYGAPGLKVATLADLDGKRVAILRGGIQQSFFDRLMIGSEYRYERILVSSLDEGYEAVVASQADAVVTNSFFAARNGRKYRLQETPIVFLPSNLYFATGKQRNADLLGRIDEYLTEWRRSSDSPYFKALYRAMSSPPQVLLPVWVQWSLAGLGAGLVLLFALSVLLRWQVEQRTRALVRTARNSSTNATISNAWWPSGRTNCGRPRTRPSASRGSRASSWPT